MALTYHERPPGLGTNRLRAVQITAVLLIAIVIGFFVKRLIIDMPHVAAGTLPSGVYDRRYVSEPWLTSVHLVPGVLYLLLAPTARLPVQKPPLHRPSTARACWPLLPSSAASLP
jgi:hypothetical protein